MIWVRTVRYLGVYISSDHVFRCSLRNSTMSSYRAFNCIYGKIGGVASSCKCKYGIVKDEMFAVFVLYLRSLSGKQISNESDDMRADRQTHRQTDANRYSTNFIINAVKRTIERHCRIT